MFSVQQFRRVLAYFFLSTYFVLLAITWDGIDFSAARTDGPLAFGFVIAVWLSYGVIYLLPALLLFWTVERLVNRGRTAARATLLYPWAVFCSGATTLFFYANAKLFTLYGFFINSFVINLVTTPGGVESLGASTASNLTFAAIALGFFVLQAGLLFVVARLFQVFGEPHWVPRRLFSGLMVIFAVMTVGERMVYAYGTATGVTSISALTVTVPYYLGMTARTLLSKVGVKVDRKKELAVSSGALNYPLNPLVVEKPAKPLNIVWLVAESLRWDMLDAEVMPSTWSFAKGATRFTRHFSGGNGTRVGVFTMFSGIPGNYWFPMLAERRGAPIIDVLKAQNYQMSLYTSAKFSYPEFDATIFSQLPSEILHEAPGAAQGWENDRINVGKMLDFIGKRDRGRPFFTFMFFESPHARYYFPPESVIRTPYPDDINYFTLSREQLSVQAPLIKNRYYNSVHHLDSQFKRVFDYLKQEQLLDSTVVIVLGDHGEEFMEKGRWGHNSSFVDEQVRTPFVLWVPGMSPRVYEGMSNHMDVVPTVMPLLGVKNPKRDYTTGVDLLTDEIREYSVLAEWSSTAYIDNEVKISMSSTQNPRVTTADDQVLSAKEQDEWFAKKTRALAAMMEELGRYISKQKTK